MKTQIALSLLLATCQLFCTAQKKEHSLTIEKIMQNPKWIGTSPDQFHWAENSQKLFFNWNPEAEEESSQYYITPADKIPYKVDLEEKKNLPSWYGSYNKNMTKKLYVKNGDIFLLAIMTGEIKQITNTAYSENSPTFNHKEDKIIYLYDNNIFSWEINSGKIEQLTNFTKGIEPTEKKPYSDDQGKWLYNDQLKLFEVLDKKKKEKERRKEESKLYEPKRPKTIYTGEARVSNIQLSPDENYITYTIYKNMRDSKNTKVANYVTESGYTEEISTRPKVGTPYYSLTEMYVYDITRDTVCQISIKDIPGIKDTPDYSQDYSNKQCDEPKERKVLFGPVTWSDNGKHAVLNIKSFDNKDRWIMLLDISNGQLKLLDRQRDEAWIGGPGIGLWGSSLGWMPDNKRIWFQSEETGYSHLYTLGINDGKKRALTKGNFEIYNPKISKNKLFWYFSSNDVHPGERHFYRMPLNGGNPTRLSFMEGRNDVYLSPDEEWLAIRFSYSNQPWELYLMENHEGAQPQKITNSLTDEFKSYPWKIPDIVKFKARDGVEVIARLYLPDSQKQKSPAVIFVHGAGYLQNAHKWWSSYFREYIFHNLLVDNGYIVLDIDYRGSAGYGRDWRTAIYRHMGGKDLTDQVDGANYLIENFNVDKKRIGIYGGSYGGFITLMAMFTEPDVFAAGAALRPVTDWSHYNHAYTSNILNTPVLDSLAFVKSSPIYYAEGLKGALLICHGMIDDNVHFQDVVRLVQRLIELGKDNWELAVYPVERHSFTEPSSWTDEYKRIFKLFEENLK
jgi:dipeptidyl aminopeptidase/acylaminoacyl peptidase